MRIDGGDAGETVEAVARRRRMRDWSWVGDIVMGLVQAGEFHLGSGR